MIELPENFDSTFRYIAVVSQRAEQLINGAKVRSDSRHHKPTLQAKDDVDAGLVSWRVLTQEEIDAQRQAMVEQFRAEVGAEVPAAAEGAQVRDVLPTSPEAAASATAATAAGDGERDEELDRLQKLLGMIHGDAGADAAADENEDEDEDEGDGDEASDEDLALDLDDDGGDGDGDDFDESEED